MSGRRVAILVVAPFASEIPRGLGHLDRVRCMAIGTRSRWPAAGPIPESPVVGESPEGLAGLVIAGTCGALERGVRTGCLVLPERLLGDDGVERAPTLALRNRVVAAARALGAPVATGTLVHVAAVIDAPSERAALRASTGAAFADMESVALADLAMSRGLPWVVLRVVSDTPERPLTWLAEILGGWPQDEPRASCVVSGVLRHPRHAPRLAHLAWTLHRARSRAGRVIADAVRVP